VSGGRDLTPPWKGRVGEGVKAQHSAPTSILPLPLPKREGELDTLPRREGRINREFGL